MKQLAALQQGGGRRGNSFRSPDSAADATVKSPPTLFWVFVHGFCCLITFVLGFRFSRLLLFLVLSSSSSPSATTIYTALRTTFPSTPPAGSRVVVGRHGILIRPWPHPDPAEVIKAHGIISRVQLEQRNQFGGKNPRTVIAVTPTYVRTFQTLHLHGVMHSLMNLPYDVVWIVVEAGGATNETAGLISKSGLKIIHIGFDGRMPRLWEDRHKLESKMRLQALGVVREKRLDGIVMFADDSNIHSMEFFDEIQKVKWIGAVSVGILARPTAGEKMPVQGPACNSSGHLVGWHTFDTKLFTSARYVGERAAVLPTKVEWAGFALNSRLVWDGADKMGWIKELAEGVESPLALLSDTSVVEPLGSCGPKVLLWWMRVEARGDSKFPPGWIINPPLSITVRAKHTPWPDTPPELPLPSFVEKSSRSTIEESTENDARKYYSQKRAGKVLDEPATSQGN